MSLSTEASMSTPPAFHQLLRTYSADQIITMVHSAARVNGQAGAVESKVTNRSVAHSKKKAVSVAAPSRATRPLNSWIAFRSYYSTMFTSLQQKDISGFLTNLWQTDPFKAKWSILAKGYSRIRDSKGKVKAPLDSYLAVNGPFIGIVPPEQYLEMLGWKIVAGDDGGRFLRRDFDLDVSSLDPELLTSNVSVNDIIQHSYTAGYIEADDVNLIMPDNEPVMTMATMMQHNLPVQSAYTAAVNNGTSGASDAATASNVGNANDTLDTDLVTSIGIFDIALTEAAVDDSEIVVNTQTAPHSQDSITPEVDTGGDWFSAAVRVPAPNPGESIFNDVFDFEKFGHYPFDNHFNPEDSVEEYNPYMGNGFNSYDISEFCDYSKYLGDM